MTTTKTKPYIYEGTGSAIDDYHKAAPAKSSPPLNGAEGRNWGLFDKDNPQHKRILANLRTANIVIKSER
ncbi:hypothetical protein, partial [Flavobacterium sp. UMI-01]|uniref:hypothetical protein n=1 Tax=Flavobacterium sp. UMI-01 TaxID=1441053 RepID=UPI001C7D2531